MNTLSLIILFVLMGHTLPLPLPNESSSTSASTILMDSGITITSTAPNTLFAQIATNSSMDSNVSVNSTSPNNSTLCQISVYITILPFFLTLLHLLVFTGLITLLIIYVKWGKKPIMIYTAFVMVICYYNLAFKNVVSHSLLLLFQYFNSSSDPCTFISNICFLSAVVIHPAYCYYYDCKPCLFDSFAIAEKYLKRCFSKNKYVIFVTIIEEKTAKDTSLNTSEILAE